MELKINPALASFKSPAVKNIESRNTKASLDTVKLVNAVNQVDELFAQRGYYDAIRSSDLYSSGNSSNGK